MTMDDLTPERLDEIELISNLDVWRMRIASADIRALVRRARLVEELVDKLWKIKDEAEYWAGGDETTGFEGIAAIAETALLKATQPAEQENGG